MSAEASNPSRVINVKVLSQLPEPDGLIHFEKLPVTTTIGELKVKVRDHVASKPAVENQRFIYRGRLMAKENDTMMDVFGRDAIASSDTHNLHLVIRAGNLPPHTPPVAQNPAHSIGGPVPQLQPPLARPQAPIQQHMQPGQVPLLPQPHVFPNMAQPHLHPGQLPFATTIFPGPGQPQPNGILHQGPFVPPLMQGFPTGPAPAPTFMLPPMQPIPGLENMLQQHMAALQHYQTTQAQPPGIPILHQGPQIPQSGQLPMPLQAMQSAQEPAPQFPQEHHTVDTNSNAPVNTPASAGQARADQPQPASGIPGPPGMTFGPQGFTRQSIGPNGERMSVSIQATSGPMPFPPFQHGFPNLHGHGPAMVFHNGHGPNPGFVRPLTPSWGLHDHSNIVAVMRRYDEALVNLGHRAEQQRTYSTEPQRTAAEGMRTQLYNIIRGRNEGQRMINDLLLQSAGVSSAPVSSTDVATLQSLNGRFQERSTEVMRSIDRVRDGSEAPGIPTADALAGPSRDEIAENSQQRATRASTNSITAYLLASPTGPHAIVFTPQGSFSSSVSNTSGLSRGPSRFGSRHHSRTPTRRHRNREAPSAALRDNGPNTPNDPAPVVPNQPVDAPAITDLVQVPRRDEAQGVPVAPADARPQEVNNDEDAFGIPGRLFRHAWLMIRLFGFIWFFTGGLGSSRTWMIAGAATIWFAIQAGLLGDRVDRVRRHLEGLLGPPNGPPVVQGAQAEVRGPPDDQQQRRNGVEPVNPEETAARLLRERAERDRGWLRQRLRTVEGAIALFVASLYPGVGERHVAAREEQRRQAEARAAELLRGAMEEVQGSNQRDDTDQEVNHDTGTEELVEPKVDVSQTSRTEGSDGGGNADTVAGSSSLPESQSNQ